MKHSFEDYPSLAQGSTDNLMDYNTGSVLWKKQWDKIHDPATVLGLFEEDQSGASIVTKNGGGLLYGNEKSAYNAMWSTSKVSGKEVFGWLTNKGVLVLPNSGNDNSTAKTDAYNIYSYNGKRYLEYDGTVLRVLGSVHTHPNGMSQTYSDVDLPFMKWYSDLPMFTLGTQEVWGSRYQPNSSGWDSTVQVRIGTLSQVLDGKSLISTINYINSLVK